MAALERAARARERAEAQQEKEQLALALIQAVDDALNLHHAEFLPASAPRAPCRQVPTLKDIEARYWATQSSNIGLFDMGRRAAAREYVKSLAAYEHNRLTQRAAQLQAAQQARLDDWWSRLNDNDEEAVIGALAEAFEDNEASAAPLGVEGATAFVVVCVPGPEGLPEHMPGRTSAGNLTIRRQTKHQLSEIYFELVCGYVLVTVKEAFAVAPGLGEVAAVAVRRGQVDAYGRHQTQAILAVRFARADLTQVQWSVVDASVVVNDLGKDVTVRRWGRSQELRELDPLSHPDIAAVLEVVDLDDEHMGLPASPDSARGSNPEDPLERNDPHPPTWAPDPTHRHQLRFWDGSKWTSFVADSGAVSNDPL